MGKTEYLKEVAYPEPVWRLSWIEGEEVQKIDSYKLNLADHMMKFIVDDNFPRP